MAEEYWKSKEEVFIWLDKLHFREVEIIKKIDFNNESKKRKMETNEANLSKNTRLEEDLHPRIWPGTVSHLSKLSYPCATTFTSRDSRRELVGERSMMAKIEQEKRTIGSLEDRGKNILKKYPKIFLL